SVSSSSTSTSIPAQATRIQASAAPTRRPVGNPWLFKATSGRWSSPRSPFMQIMQKIGSKSCSRSRPTECPLGAGMAPAFVSLGFAAMLAMLPAAGSDGRGSGGTQQCTDPKSGKAIDCVPGNYTVFDIPFAKLPGGRMNAQGELDPKSSPEDAHKGA